MADHFPDNPDPLPGAAEILPSGSLGLGVQFLDGLMFAGKDGREPCQALHVCFLVSLVVREGAAPACDRQNRSPSRVSGTEPEGSWTLISTLTQQLD
jgi:hypothetical protein